MCSLECFTWLLYFVEMNCHFESGCKDEGVFTESIESCCLRQGSSVSTTAAGGMCYPCISKYSVCVGKSTFNTCVVPISLVAILSLCINCPLTLSFTHHDGLQSHRQQGLWGGAFLDNVTLCGKTNLVPHLFKIEIFIVLESTFSTD